LSLLLNDPNIDPEGTVFSLKVEVRKENTLSELKQIVSDLINIPTAEFVLKRYMVQREFKNMNAKLSELGLSNGNLIKIEKGKPHQDGVYDVKINQVAIIGHKTPIPMPDAVSEVDAPDSFIFNSTFLFNMQIAPNATAIEFKQKIVLSYNEQMALMDPSLAPIELDQVRIRNPKVDDIGDVILDNSSLDYQYLYDEKDIYMQIVD